VLRVLLVSAARGDGVIGVGENLVLRHAFAVFVGDAQIELGVELSLLSGFSEPRDRLRIIAAHAVSLGIHHSEVVLRRRVSLRRRLAEPLDRLDVVLRHAVAGRVDHAQLGLGGGAATSRGFAKPDYRLRLVLCEALAEFVHQSESVLRLRVATIRQRAQFLRRRGIVALPERVQSLLKTGDARSRKQHGERKDKQRARPK
jgi:hypothetical protein